tara:strand:+ start:302 stop:466 length:165 start_codon:yes stop_codon:yes gene_type:complete
MRLRKAWRWAKKKAKARVNKQGLMGSASREHRVKKGKGSFRRRKKHQNKLDNLD